MEQERKDYADRDRPPGRIPSLGGLVDIGLLLAALAAAIGMGAFVLASLER